MDVHHHDSTGGAAAGISALMVALFAFVAGIILLIALVAWAPWDDDNASGGAIDQPNAEENAPANVDIEGDIDIGTDGGEQDAGQ